LLIGISAIVVHSLHILTDILEVVNDFTFYQLVLTYIAFLFIPFVIIGLYAVYWKKLGLLGLIGSICYGISFIYFASTAIYAINSLKNGINNYEIIYNELGIVYVLHGAIMVIGGILFSVSVIKTKVVPIFTGIVLIIGLLINALFSILPINPNYQIIGSIVRNIGFIGIGISIIYDIKHNKIV
jgi:hypothetical protein